MTNIVTKADISALLGDDQFRKEMVARLVNDEKFVKKIGEETADLVDDILEDHPEFREALVKELIASENVRNILTKEVAAKMDE